MKQVIETPSSSNIAQIEYDGEQRELQVTFTKGGVYKYKDVPTEVFNMISQAESVGSAFNTLVKNGGYSYEKVGGNTDTMKV